VRLIGFPARRHLVRALVELEVGEAQDALVLGLVTGAAQDGMHPGDHFHEGERLGHVVVTTDGEAGHLVLAGRLAR
jgi:hypothetical protein